ncbi:helix-turn-helix domain-containing protein [Streptomyces clavuligerus]|uniref:helix-turn-helix domain-containing protein n=1 Tax=Streptomyces clavuligerus TaxID=1901 RepID=UPI0001851EB0|nr:helix-turn-helix transcriptional regulator [Streptomyces clavuligerus]WDN54212.1 helix-turn-helix transcriptional regulator [Streptomyces clavuligerus]
MGRPKKAAPSARQLFGTKLRRYREDAGLTQEALGLKVQISKSHLSRIENAEYMPPPELPKALDDYFQTGGIFAELYEVCVLEVYPNQFRRSLELESRALVIKQYCGQLIPGLLQTEAYARALFDEFNPYLSPEEIDEYASGRMARQARLRGKDAPDCSFIVDEAALMRRVGGPDVWREQLVRLAEETETKGRIVQILPLAAGCHGLMGGSLVLMALEEGVWTAYEESISTGTVLEEYRAVLRREQAYGRLMARAWSPARTAEHIRSLIEEHAT